MEERIVELIESIRNLAPEAWEVLVRQQIIEGWMQVGIAGVATIFCMIRWMQDDIRDDAGAQLLVAAVWLIIAGSFAVLGAMNILNPDFYAIKELMPR